MKTTLLTLFIFTLSFISEAKKVYSPFKLTVVDRFTRKELSHVKVDLYTSGKKSHLIKTLYTNESGFVSFDSLVKGDYRYEMTLNDDYITGREYFTIYSGWSLETTKELDLSDNHKRQILAPYRITPQDKRDVFSLNEHCSDSLENRTLIYAKGFENLRKDVDSLLHYPQSAMEMGTEGKVYVHFITDEEGKVIKVGVQKSSGDESLDLEAMLLVILLDRFEPHVCNGKPVKALYSFPLTFRFL